jgi:hypothetical protein
VEALVEVAKRRYAEIDHLDRRSRGRLRRHQTFARSQA